jgi:hypothetical protein
MRLILSAGLILSLAQGAGLKIVVVEGEDAVNIIQQRTAVAPVVEVRDRNDLPVAGVAVLFAINGGGASFPAGQALTVTTDAAGRATAAGLAPTGNGAIQIDVTATSQGQTATATIHQTNFATVRDVDRIRPWRRRHVQLQCGDVRFAAHDADPAKCERDRRADW